MATRLARCCRGIAAVEFAFAAPAVFLAAAILIELAMMMFVSALIEGGLREAARFGITGYTPAGITREQRIRQIVADNTIGLIDMSTAEISQKIYPSFEDVGKPEPFTDSNGNGAYDAGETFQDINGNGQWDADMGLAGAGGPGDIVLYTVTADWFALTPLLSPFLEDGKIRIHASIAVRNEPYDLTLPSGGGGS